MNAHQRCPSGSPWPVSSVDCLWAQVSMAGDECNERMRRTPTNVGFFDLWRRRCTKAKCRPRRWGSRRQTMHLRWVGGLPKRSRRPKDRSEVGRPPKSLKVRKTLREISCDPDNNKVTPRRNSAPGASVWRFDRPHFAASKWHGRMFEACEACWAQLCPRWGSESQYCTIPLFLRQRAKVLTESLRTTGELLPR